MLKYMSRHDGLTGICGRNYVDKLCRRMIIKCTSYLPEFPGRFWSALNPDIVRHLELHIFVVSCARLVELFVVSKTSPNSIILYAFVSRSFYICSQVKSYL